MANVPLPDRRSHEWRNLKDAGLRTGQIHYVLGLERKGSKSQVRQYLRQHDVSPRRIKTAVNLAERRTDKFENLLARATKHKSDELKFIGEDQHIASATQTDLEWILAHTEEDIRERARHDAESKRRSSPFWYH